MATKLELHAQEAAYEIIRRPAIRKVITEQFRRDAIDLLASSHPSDAEGREQIHKLFHAMEEFFGRLENLAAEAQYRKENTK